MTATITERVAKGAAFLDEHDPGWWRPEAISLDALEMGDPESCILGQRCPVEVLARFCDLSPQDLDDLSHEAFRSFTAYAEVLSGFREDTARDALVLWGDEHGFSNSADGSVYTELTNEWVRVIRERREAVKVGTAS